MAQCRRLAPVNSLIFIAGGHRVRPPDGLELQTIAADAHCISVACLMWQDGETLVGLGDALDLQRPEVPAFDGMLETPDQTVLVSTVEREVILEQKVPDTRTRVRLWINSPSEPDEVVIGLG